MSELQRKYDHDPSIAEQLGLLLQIKYFSNGHANSIYQVQQGQLASNEEVLVLGTMRLNSHNSSIFMDSPLAFIKSTVSGQLDEFLSSIRSKLAVDFLKLLGFWALAVASVYGIFRFSQLLQGNIQKQKFEAMKNIYRELDHQNRLENSPPFVRAAANNLEKVQIDSYKCIRCKENVREIVNLDCMHCYMCFVCFKGKKNKFVCNVCSKRVEKIVRIYVC